MTIGADDVITIQDSYGSKLELEYIADNGEHPACVQVAISSPDGTRYTNVQFVGEGGVVRLFEALASFSDFGKAVQS